MPSGRLASAFAITSLAPLRSQASLLTEQHRRIVGDRVDSGGELARGDVEGVRKRDGLLSRM